MTKRIKIKDANTSVISFTDERGVEWSGIPFTLDGNNNIVIEANGEISRKAKEYFEKDADPVQDYVEPPETIPQTITRYQAKIQMKNTPFGQNSNLLKETKNIIKVQPEDSDLEIAFDNATVFERNSPLISQLAAGFSLTDEQVDQLFLAASKVK